MKKNNYFIIWFVALIFATSAFAESINPVDGTSSTSFLNTILLAIGLVLLGWYQKYQIDILKKELESHKSLISSLKQYSDILDVNKVKEFVQVSEIAIQKKKDLEINELESNFTAQIRLMESEKEQLIKRIKESAETTEKLKADYESIVETFSQRITAFYRYRELFALLGMTSNIQERILLNARSLLTLLGIEDPQIENATKETSEILGILVNAHRSIDDSNFSQIENKLSIPEIFYACDVKPYREKLYQIVESLNSQFDNIIAQLRTKLKRMENSK